MGEEILIAGAGAIGSVFGAMLRRAGHRVALLGRPAHLEAIARAGLRIGGIFGEHIVRGFDLADDPARLRGRFGLILCAVKSYDTAAMAGVIAERIADDGIVVSLQNGLGNLEALAARLGPGRILGGRVIFGAEFVKPGAVRVTVFAEPVAIGPDPALGGDAAQSLAARAREIATLIAAAGIPTVAVDDIEPVLWAKVLYNAALNPLGALHGLAYGELAADPDLRAIMDDAIGEAFAVASRLGVKLPYPNAAAYRDIFYGRLVPVTAGHRPTMLYDLKNRGRTEIDALNGKVAELAARLGIAAPVNRTLTRMVHAAERLRKR
ncbi:MAG: ketopantoate reductase family protein [Candidatus Binataceae bacterium]